MAGAARAAEVLRPGGRLAVFWNAGEPPPELQEAFSAVYRRVLPDAPIFRAAFPGVKGYTALLAKAADGMRAAGGFGEPEERRFDWECTYTREEWLDMVPTAGGHSRLPPETLEALLAGLGAAVDAAGGGFTMRYGAVLVSAARTARGTEAPRAGGVE